MSAFESDPETKRRLDQLEAQMAEAERRITVLERLLDGPPQYQMMTGPPMIPDGDGGYKPMAEARR